MSRTQAILNSVLSRLGRFEPIMIGIALISIAIKEFTEIQVGPFLIISISSLTVFYYFHALLKPKVAAFNMIGSYVHKIGYLSCSVGTMAILFTLMKWEGGAIFSLMTVFTLAFALLVVLYFVLSGKGKEYFPAVLQIRWLAVFGVCLTHFCIGS